MKHIPGSDYISKLPEMVTDKISGATTSGAPLNAPLEDAHRLPNPDAFLPHFDAVAKMRPITLAEAKAGCPWTREDKINFQYGWDTGFAKVERNESEIIERRNALHDFVKRGMVPWSQAKGHFKGRGIVTLGGNEEGKTFKRLLITLNALKRVGSQLPVEVHHWGDELSEENKQLILSNYPHTFFHDLAGPDNVIKIWKHMMPNFQFKIAAMLNSRFAEPFLLDSDNLALFDPEELYESETYREYGTIFWPDIARTLPMNPIWPITNTVCRMDEYEQESGQLLIDKRKFWYHLQLSLYFLDKDDDRLYYAKIILGDKDAFRFAWHALKTKYGFPAKWLSSVGIVRKEDNQFCGHSFAQYHPDLNDGRPAFFHGGLLKSFQKTLVKWLYESKQGLFQYYKASPVPTNHSANPTEINIGIMGANGIVPNEDPGARVAFCTQFSDVEPRPLDEIAPGFEKTFEAIQGYWIILDVD